MSKKTKLEHLTNSNLFSNYYLKNLLPESDNWKDVDEENLHEKYSNIKEIYRKRKNQVEYFNENDLERKFIEPILEALGFSYGTEETIKGSGRTPDYGMFQSEEILVKTHKKKDNKGFYRNAITLAEAKKWGKNLDLSDKRDFKNPSYQINVYLQEAPVDWGVLTNGKKWRLYYSKTSHKLDSYYEIDLTTLLEKDVKVGLKAFKYFYLLFRPEAFVKDNRGECFLDKVHDRSNLFSQELGEDLKENIYEAIRLLSEGFLEFPENDLDPEEELELIHDSSLIYLYRLIFVLYAESEGRDLLDTDNRKYHEDYSLNSLKQKVCDELEEADPKYTNWQCNLWDRLERLFVLIDKGSKNRGIPEDELYIPAYNGGLFNTEVDEETSKENVFLQENKVGDSYLGKVIDLLTRHESQNGEGRVFVDYSDLDIRDLGSIYEGLLEYHLNVASKKMVAVKEDGEEKWYPKKDYKIDEKIIEEVDEGGIYLTTDKGKRKATGSYYTPEYIVQYIVENTLDPILNDIREDLLRQDGGNFAHQFAERVFELKILDPAMGSGHFLTNAVDHLANEIFAAHQKQAEEKGPDSIDESHDIHWARRQVAQKCIYGVDLNPMAVELAKVSLWLRTLAAQQPLAFLDHHLKTGNSLIGSDIEDIEELDSGGKKEDIGNATLEDFGMTWKGTMEDLMSIYKEFIKIENQELSDIKKMEEKYHKFEHEPIKERLEAIANVHTSREFGVNVPEKGFTRMAKAIDDELSWKKIEKEDWFDEAQKVAEDKNFFHWMLAFPEVFYEDEGVKKESTGFDAVIGNPPWNAALNKTERDFMRKNYPNIKGNLNTAVIFMDLSLDLSKNECSYIVPKSLCYSSSWEEIRDIIVDGLDQLIDAGMAFEGVLLESAIARYSKYSESNKTEVGTIDENTLNSYYVEKQLFKDLGIFFTGIDKENLNICLKMLRNTDGRLDDYLKIQRGKLLRKYTKKEGVKPIYRGKNISQFRLGKPDRFLSNEDFQRLDDELGYMKKPKLLIQNIVAHIKTPTDHIQLMSYEDNEGVLCNDTVSCGFPNNDALLNALNGLLNSTLISWYSYRLVYAMAIRTMHFDNVHLRRIPANKEITSNSKIGEISSEIQAKKKDIHQEKEEFLEWIEAQWNVHIDNLSLKTHIRKYWEYDFDELMRVAKRNKSIIEKNVESRKFRELMKKEWKNSMKILEPLINDINDLENQLDALVFHSYGLDEKDLKIVLNDLQVDEENIEDMVLKFNNLST